MKKVIFLLIAGVLLFMKPLLAAEGSDVPERERVMSHIFAVSDEIVRITRNQDAEEVMKFLHESFCMGAPMLSAAGYPIEIIHTSAGKYHVCMVPLISRDRKMSRRWREMYDSNVAALFMPIPGHMQIILKESVQFSKIWQGLLFIHEGSHALNFATDVLNGINDPLLRQAKDESIAYRIQTSLVEKLGGAAYQKILEEEMVRLEKDYLKNGIFLGPEQGLYRERIEKIFGKSEYDLEADIRSSVLWAGAACALIERRYKADKAGENHRIDFFLTAYKKGYLK